MPRAYLPRSVANFRFFADYPRFCEDESLPSSTHHIYTSYEPVGVTAAISPWNFPLMLSTWKVAPALAFGNTVVLKPAEQSPGTCTRLGELAIEAGLPRGVLNILHGYGPGEAGEALTTSRDVDLVTFTGESNTGRKILQAGAPSLKRVSFELGGKSANLVFADADLDAALDWSIKAAFTNSGQVCLAGSRLYVERAIFDEFVDRFVNLSERLVVGDPTDPATDIGPRQAKNTGRRCATASRSPKPKEPSYSPAVRTKAGGSGRRCWSTPPRRCGSAVRRSSARSSPSHLSTVKPTRSGWRMTPDMA